MNIRCSYLCLILLLGSSAVSAQIVTDGTVGPATSLSGPEMTIGAELGSTREANLFHSFQRFDIPTGHQATFTGPEQVRNVIGRVTGGQTSNIDGTLRSTVGQADVYLINPSGIVMGPNARVDVPAALHLSTADEVRFSDGSRYSATDPSNSTLTLAAPESFGFLSPQPASLTIAGSQLELKPGKTVTLTAGDVSLSGTSERPAILKAPGGEIRIEAVGERGASVPVDRPSDIPGNGRLSIVQAGLENTGDGGGRQSLRGGAIDLNGVGMLVYDTGHTDTISRIDVFATGNLTLSGQSWIFATTIAAGSAADIAIRAGRLELADGSRVASETRGEGRGGDIWIETDTLHLYGSSHAATGITTTAGEGASGRAGQIAISVEGLAHLAEGARISTNTNGASEAGSLQVRAGTLELMDRSRISSDTSGTGPAGAIEIQAAELRLDGQSWISSHAFEGSFGQAGEVRVDIDGSAVLTNRSYMLSITLGEGDGGELGVRAGTLALLDGSMISSSTYASGDAGLVRIAAEDLSIVGSDLVSSGIFGIASPGSTGQAGRVEVDIAGSIAMMGSARIESSTYAGGNGGQVRVAADELRIDGRDLGGVWTGISSGTGNASSGNAGQVDVRVDGMIELLRGAQIDSSAYATGNAGPVRVEAGELRIDGLGSDRFTGITSGTTRQSTGDADEVRVEVAGLIELLGGGQIDSSAYGAGNAGQIYVQAGSLRLDGAGESPWPTAITSHAVTDSTGNASDVSVSASDRLEIRRGATIDSVTLSVGDAGTVVVTAGTLDIDGAGTELFTGVTSQAGRQSGGQVGTILVRADSLNLANKGAISIGAYQTSISDRPAESSGRRPIIDIEAREIRLDAGRIDAQSTSRVAASPIRITANQIALINSSKITTEATQNDAGQIELSGGRLWLTDSLITTSANGAIGDGGDITLTPEYLILDGGFVQANTVAPGARGGDIRVDSRVLIAGESLVEIGGNTRQDFIANSGRNIIQAAAPGGEQGTIEVTSPDLDITAALVPLAAAFEDPDDLFTDLCRGLTGSAASSLVERGAGGLPRVPGAPASVSFTAERLDRMPRP
jgi:filamentous hemagglutinin family protein